MRPPDQHREWLEPDGLGGFASGTESGIRTRRYHALLLTAATPPTGRVALVNGVEVWADTPAGSFALSAQRYEPGVDHPDGATRITSFTTEPWPTWTFTLPDGTVIEHSIVVRHGQPTVSLSWRLVRPMSGVALRVRPLVSGRDYHALHRENGAFRFEPSCGGAVRVWSPYERLPSIHVLTNGTYEHAPDWYRHFRYEAEYERGLDGTEDLASPGVFRFSLDDVAAEIVFAAAAHDETPFEPGAGATAFAAALRDCERARRAAFPSRLHRAADAYLVARGSGRTIVAGYPWFTDWGRDTFIALRGICLAAGRVDDARRILVEWAGTISEGMLPNRFADHGEEPEFNSVDASLWFVIAVHELFEAAARTGAVLERNDCRRLESAVDAILTGYAAGTRFGIRLDADGLLAAGEPGVQLTWMDAKVGDWVVTPRIGKPVEVQALWLNALWLAGQRTSRWLDVFERGRQAFGERFWNDTTGALNDVVDVNHEPGTFDASFRPNQIFALGGLPVALVEGVLAQQAIDAIERRLWTPIGLRSLAPGEPGYIGHYGGGVRERDGAYHQGTVWPWLLTAFVDAWVRVRGNRAGARAAARRRFLDPLLAHLGAQGVGHVSEIADGDAPHRPNGCPFQAWSVGEALRLDRLLS
ncbi:MAG TPA: amylo-alpha-1,6-glucosidase [Vicinamibacterales bacterium]|nr:amylo-alpha-1,6-glucosidase [Vicinamibacterales bacterium]